LRAAATPTLRAWLRVGTSSCTLRHSYAARGLSLRDVLRGSGLTARAAVAALMRVRTNVVARRPYCLSQLGA
jgi:hypothetical protein